MMVISAAIFKESHFAERTNTSAIEPCGGSVLKSFYHLPGARQALVPGCW